MSVTIRQRTEEDIPEIYRLIKEFALFQQTPEKVKITPEQMKEEKEFFHCFVAVDAARVVGFASYYFAYYSWSGKALYLDDLYVSTAFRGNGIGSRLMQSVIGLAKEEQCTKMRWQVSKWNKEAIDFYQKLGASIDDVEINCDLPL